MHLLCHDGLKKGAGHFLKDNIQQKRNEFDSYTTTYFISLNKPCCQYTRITTLKPLQSVVSALAQPNVSHTHTEWDCASIQTVRLPTQVGNKPTCNTLIKRQLKGKKVWNMMMMTMNTPWNLQADIIRMGLTKVKR